MSLTQAFVSVLAGHFPHQFTDDQAQAVSQMARFILQPQADEVFVLRGYAGTGKTSLVGALVRTLTDLHREVVLMAPTGRAAKVFSAYAGQKAMTIHKAIYRQQTFQGEGTRFSLGYNKRKHALFIVDEASMIAVGGIGVGTFGTGELLADLIRYVCKGYSKACFQIRNEWMVDRSARVIAVYNGEPGGTRNTIEYAEKNKVECFKI